MLAEKSGDEILYLGDSLQTARSYFLPNNTSLLLLEPGGGLSTKSAVLTKKGQEVGGEGLDGIVTRTFSLCPVKGSPSFILQPGYFLEGLVMLPDLGVSWFLGSGRSPCPKTSRENVIDTST